MTPGRPSITPWRIGPPPVGPRVSQPATPRCQRGRRRVPGQPALALARRGEAHRVNAPHHSRRFGPDSIRAGEIADNTPRENSRVQHRLDGHTVCRASSAETNSSSSLVPSCQDFFEHKPARSGPPTGFGTGHQDRIDGCGKSTPTVRAAPSPPPSSASTVPGASYLA